MLCNAAQQQQLQKAYERMVRDLSRCKVSSCCVISGETLAVMLYNET
jgi:hypothetical protein